MMTHNGQKLLSALELAVLTDGPSSWKPEECQSDSSGLDRTPGRPDSADPRGNSAPIWSHAAGHAHDLTLV